MEEPRPTLALYPTSEPSSVGPFPSFYFLCTMPHSVGRWRRADSDSGEKGREGGTSEASLVSNKRGDQTCSLPVRENIILENGRTAWCRRGRVSYVPILSSNAIALIWFQGSLREIETKCAAFDAPPLTDLSPSFFCLFFLHQNFPGCSRRWKHAFLIPLEATRPLQNTHFPINKYTKTFSHLSQSQMGWQKNRITMETKYFSSLSWLEWEPREWWNYTIILLLTFLSCHGDSLGR